MAESESAPLLVGKRGDFREIEQQANAPDVVACCCVESTRLAKVPVIRSMFRKRRPEEKVIIFSSLLASETHSCPQILLLVIKYVGF